MLPYTFAILLLSGLLADSPAESAGMSGTWRLNVERSDFGADPPPRSVEVKVVHKEPSLRYQGRAVDSKGSAHPIDFEGVLDAKPHRMRHEPGGVLTSRRIDSRTIATDWKSDDGRHTESSVMSLAEDGRTITIRRHTEGGGRKEDAVEVYEK